MKKSLLFLGITLFTMTVASAQNVGDLFTTANINYKVTNVAPNEVTVTGSTLAAVVIPASVTDTGTSTTFSVTSIFGGAFYNSTTITSVSTPSTLKSIEANTTTANNATFRGTANLQTADFSASTLLTTFPATLFRASGVKSVILPVNLTTIPDNSFRDCIGLTTVELRNPTPAVITSLAFNGVTISGVDLNVPVGSVDSYKAAAVWSTFKTVTASMLSVNSFEEQTNWNLYPNPTTGTVFVKNDNADSATISVYDLNGKAVVSQNVSGSNSEINLSNVSSGIYLFKVKTAKGEIVKRIVKQ